MITLDITKEVKFKNPGTGEENLIFDVVNYNEVNERCYIQCKNSGMKIEPQELVSINDLVNV
jgi:hypothetical protein